jgi:hypothetical protein
LGRARRSKPPASERRVGAAGAARSAVVVTP